jgi:hypothetical protein
MASYENKVGARYTIPSFHPEIIHGRDVPVGRLYNDPPAGYSRVHGRAPLRLNFPYGISNPFACTII